MKKSRFEYSVGCAGAILTFIVIAIICNTVGWLLWNWVMPAVFNLPTITWLQFFGLYLIIQCMFRININYNKHQKNNDL